MGREYRGDCSIQGIFGSNKNGGWITKTLPAMMRKQRRTKNHVRGLLRITLSRKTLNTGDVKLTTIRTPIGMKGTAAWKLEPDD